MSMALAIFSLPDQLGTAVIFPLMEMEIEWIFFTEMESKNGI